MQIPHDWDVPEPLREQVADRVGRQRALIDDGHLLLVLHRVPKPGKPEREGTLFWRNPAGEWHANQTGGAHHLLAKHIEAYAKAVDAQEAEFEGADSPTAYHSVSQSISPVNRAANHMNAVLQTARDAFQDDGKLGSIADWAYEVSRAADLLTTDAKNAMGFELARQASIQAEASTRLAKVAHRLNVIAALFLPLMALASLFGMNLHSGLDDKTPSMFWGVLFAGVVLGFLVWGVALRPGGVRPPAKHGRRMH